MKVYLPTCQASQERHKKNSGTLFDKYTKEKIPPFLVIPGSIPANCVGWNSVLMK